MIIAYVIVYRSRGVLSVTSGTENSIDEMVGL